MPVTVPATLLYAGLMALMAVFLANYVLWVRLRARSLPEWRAHAAERVQANFVENVPLALICLYLVEIAGAGALFVHTCGAALVVLRVLHAWGLASNQGANYPRLIGAQGTFVLVSILGMAAVALFLGIGAAPT